MDDLLSALQQRTPPIALVNTLHLEHWSLEAAHAVVVLGLDEQTVTINDPAMPAGQSVVGLDNFWLAWDDMANLYCLLRRR